MDQPLYLIVHAPKGSRHVRKEQKKGQKKEQKLPVFIHVHPANAALDVWAENHSGKTIKYAAEDTQFGGFNKVVWIDNKVVAGKDHTLHVRASADGFQTIHQRCKIRLPKPKAVSPTSSDPPPSIVYPPDGANLGCSFPCYGYVDPSTDPVEAFAEDANGNRYPGSQTTPPQPYDWDDSFANLPSGSYTLYAVDTATNQISEPVNVTVTC
jgi:hypothetical protein